MDSKPSGSPRKSQERLAGAKYLLCVRVLIASPRLVEDIPGCPYQHKKQKKKADCLRVSYARENRETRISWAHVTPFHPTNQPTRKPIRKIDCFRHKLAEWGRTIHADCDGWLAGWAIEDWLWAYFSFNIFSFTVNLMPGRWWWFNYSET